MSENEQLDAISLGTINTIILAANPPMLLSPETTDVLRRWLAREMACAFRRAHTSRLTSADIDKFEMAYRRFCLVIEELQDRDDPPPRVPVSDGSTDWEHWMSGHQHFGFKRGRRQTSDWRTIGKLLALYETLSGKKASAAQRDGPTMRFLRIALPVIAHHAPADAPNNFTVPTADALKQQLPRLRKFALPTNIRRIANIINSAG